MLGFDAVVLEKFFHTDPDKSEGNARSNKAILHKRTFKGTKERLPHIVLHKIGHCLDRNLLTFLCQRQHKKPADKFAQKLILDLLF